MVLAAFLGYRQGEQEVHRLAVDGIEITTFEQFGDSSLNMQFSVWAVRESWLEMRNQMHLQVKAAFDAAGIEIPYPRRELYIKQQTT